jgi:protein-tyrosine phosphatase
MMFIVWCRFLGGWPPSDSLLPPGEPSVVDVTCELPKQHGSRYLCLPTWDTQGPTPELIEQGVRWSLKESADGQPIYIHCAHGHGRSATVMCAAFIASGKAKDIDDAVAVLRRARPRVRLNKKQRAVVQAWLDTYHKSSGKGEQAGGVTQITADAARK